MFCYHRAHPRPVCGTCPPHTAGLAHTVRLIRPVPASSVCDPAVEVSCHTNSVFWRVFSSLAIRISASPAVIPCPDAIQAHTDILECHLTESHTDAELSQAHKD